MRTAKEIMNLAFNEALDIINNRPVRDLPSMDARFIAASNLAMAIFSYEAEMEAMKDAHEQMDDDDDNNLLIEDAENG